MSRVSWHRLGWCWSYQCQEGHRTRGGAGDLPAWIAGLKSMPVNYIRTYTYYTLFYSYWLVLTMSLWDINSSRFCGRYFSTLQRWNEPISTSRVLSVRLVPIQHRLCSADNSTMGAGAAELPLLTVLQMPPYHHVLNTLNLDPEICACAFLLINQCLRVSCFWSWTGLAVKVTLRNWRCGVLVRTTATLRIPSSGATATYGTGTL